MQSWEPRLPPSVGLMPSPSPKQLAPTSLIILARAHTHTHTHIKTPTKWDTDTLDGVDGYHTMIKSAELGKVLLKCILATWASVRWRLPTWIDYSHWPGRELSRRPIDSMKEEQTGQKLTSVLVMREILVIIFFYKCVTLSSQTLYSFLQNCIHPLRANYTPLSKCCNYSSIVNYEWFTVQYMSCVLWLCKV